MALFEVEHLTIAYESGRKGSALSPEAALPHLEDLSFALEAGTVYDLTGPSGAGKSMLLRACAQMMPLQSGSLLLEGNDSATLTYQQWRRQVSLVPQRASLIPGTIRENLLLPWTLKVHGEDNRPTDAELERLLDAALLDVELSRDAAKLSGGQAARVALIRTFATRPRVILLDEVDAALDDESARAVGHLTQGMTDGHTTCLRIRHRPPDGIAQGIFHLEGGKLTYRETAATPVEEVVLPWTAASSI